MSDLPDDWVAGDTLDAGDFNAHAERINQQGAEIDAVEADVDAAEAVNATQSADIDALEAADADDYEKPGTGIPASDLAAAVQTSLGKADSAIQPGNSALTDQRTPTDNSVTSAKIVDGTIVAADIADAAITRTKLTDWTAVDDLTLGEATMRRQEFANFTRPAANGVVRLTYFTAKKTETITKLRSLSGDTAQAGATLCRIGVYEEDQTTGDLTLVAATASDTSLWLAATTSYTRNLIAPWDKVRGHRYAAGVLQVGTSTAATFTGRTGLLDEDAVAPRLAGQRTGQTDLPSSIAVANIAASNAQIYVAVLP